MEYDGVIVEDTSDIQRKAWQQMAEEEGKRAPPQFLLQRAEGMKNDQVCSVLICLAHTCCTVLGYIVELWTKSGKS